MPDPQPWWLTLPPCPRCGLGHVLIDCSKRLSFEVGEEARVTRQVPGQLILACSPEDQLIAEAERDGTLRTIQPEEADGA